MKEIEQKWAACIVYYQDQVSLNNLLESLENQSLKFYGQIRKKT
jgi:hypothetical protein